MAGTDDDVAVHDEVLDGHHAAARLAEQIVTVERRIERLRAHSRQQRMRILVRGPPQHSAEATRIVEADEFAAVESSEEHTSEHQSLMRNSYAVFWLKKKNQHFND